MAIISVSLDPKILLLAIPKSRNVGFTSLYVHVLSAPLGHISAMALVRLQAQLQLSTCGLWVYMD